MRKNSHWINWATLWWGAWVFLIPWFADHNLAEETLNAVVWNFWIVGAAIFLTAALALRDIKPWEEWTTMMVGLWLFFSPWIFSYTEESILMWNSLIIGFVVAILSSLALPIAINIQKNTIFSKH